MTSYMNITVRVISAQAIARLRQVQAQSAATTATVAKSAAGAGAFSSALSLSPMIKFGNQLQWIGRQLQYNFTIPILLAAGAGVKFALDNEKAFVRITKVYGDFSMTQKTITTEVNALKEAFVALSEVYGTQQKDVLNIAADWAAAGASGLDLAKATEITLKTMVLGEMNATDATKALISIQAQYGLGLGSLMTTVNKFNIVENQTGASMQDLIRGFERTASVAKTAGMPINELLAMIAALTPAAGSATAAGNSLKTIISKLFNQTKGAKEVMGALGIETNKLSWANLNGTERLKVLAKAYDGLGQAQKMNVADTMANMFQINKFGTLMDAINSKHSYYKKSLQATSDKQKVFTQAQKELNQVLSSNPQKLKQTFVILQNAMAEIFTPLIPYLLLAARTLKNLIKRFQELPGGFQKGIVVGLLFLALFGPLIRYIGSTITLIKVFGAGFGWLMRQIFGASGALKKFIRVLGLLYDALLAVIARSMVFIQTKFALFFSMVGRWATRAAGRIGLFTEAVGRQWIRMTTWISTQTALMAVKVNAWWTAMLVRMEAMLMRASARIGKMWRWAVGIWTKIVAWGTAQIKIWWGFLMWWMEGTLLRSAVRIGRIWGKATAFWAKTVAWGSAEIKIIWAALTNYMTLTSFRMGQRVGAIYARFMVWIAGIMLAGSLRIEMIQDASYVRMQTVQTAFGAKTAAIWAAITTWWQGIIAAFTSRVLVMWSKFLVFWGKLTYAWGQVFTFYWQLITKAWLKIVAWFTVRVNTLWLWMTERMVAIQLAFGRAMTTIWTWMVTTWTKIVAWGRRTILILWVTMLNGMQALLIAGAAHLGIIWRALVEGLQVVLAWGGRGLMAIWAATMAAWAFITAAGGAVVEGIVAATMATIEAITVAGEAIIAAGLPGVIALAIAAIVVLLIVYRKQIWAFVKWMVEGLVKLFVGLAKGVYSVMKAIVTIISNAVKAAWEWLKQLNPFQRHSPSLVDNVQNGMKAIGQAFSTIVKIKGPLQDAAADIGRFNKAIAAFKHGMDTVARAKDLAKIIKVAPGAVDEFKALVKDLQGLGRLLDVISAKMKRQEGVVAGLQKSLDALNKTLDAEQDILDGLTEKAGEWADKMAGAQSELDRFSSAPIEGMKAMGDKIFENDMAQKKLRLEFLKMEEVVGPVDDLRAKLAALAGDIENLRGEQANLRALGAGSDILGVYDDQIAALESQRTAINDSIKPFDDLQTAMDELGRKGEILDLENSLQFDPLLRQIDQLANGMTELPFDVIMAGITSSKKDIETYTTAWNLATQAVKDQQAVVDAATVARDAVADQLDIEAAKLDVLRDKYDLVNQAIQDINSSLSDMVALADQKIEDKAAKKAARKAAKVPSTDLQNFQDSGAGDFATPGGDAKFKKGIKGLNAWIKKQQEKLATQLGDFDVWGPFKDMFHGGLEWIKSKWTAWSEWDVQFWDGVLQKIREKWDGLVSWFKDKFDVWGPLKNIWLDIKEKLVGKSIIPDMIDDIVQCFKDLPGKLWDALVELWDKIHQRWMEVKNGFTTWATNTWEDIKTWFSNLPGKIWDELKDLWTKIHDRWTEVRTGISTWATNTWTDISTWWSELPGKIKTKLVNLWTDIHSKWAEVRTGIATWATNTWTDIQTWWSELPGKIKAELIELKTKVVSRFNDMKEGVIEKFGDVEDYIKTFYKDHIKPHAQTVINGFYDMFSGIAHAVHDGVNLAKDAVNLLIDALNWVSDHVPVLDFHINALVKTAYKKGSPPELAAGGIVTNKAMAIVGEGNSSHPEYVIPTDPRHRGNALRLMKQAQEAMGIGETDGTGGVGDVFGSIKSAVAAGAKSVETAALNAFFKPVEIATEKLTDKLPEFMGIRQMGKNVLNDVKDAITGVGKTLGAPWQKPTTYGPGLGFGNTYSDGSFHSGQDFPSHGVYGPPIHAVASGTVADAYDIPGSSPYNSFPYASYGRVIKIAHAGGIQSLYAHLQEKLVRKGDEVTAGQLIGKMGSMGNSTGPHLHFELKVNGATVNPMPILAAHGINYDSGGWMQPGSGGMNTSKSPEPVLSASQWGTVERSTRVSMTLAATLPDLLKRAAAAQQDPSAGRSTYRASVAMGGQGETITAGRSTVTVNIYGDLVMPNVKSGDDADTFIKHLERLAG